MILRRGVQSLFSFIQGVRTLERLKITALESNDDEYLSSDDGEVYHVSDYASSDSTGENDREDVYLTAAATSFLSKKIRVLVFQFCRLFRWQSSYSQHHPCNSIIMVCQQALWFLCGFIYVVSVSTFGFIYVVSVSTFEFIHAFVNGLMQNELSTIENEKTWSLKI